MNRARARGRDVRARPTAASLVLGIAATCAACTRAPDAVEASRVLGPPPRELLTPPLAPGAILPTRVASDAGIFHVCAFFEPEDQQIDLETTHTPARTRSDPEPSPDLKRVISKPVDYWPTSVGDDDGRHVLVAGKSADGNTRIERWEVSEPGLAEAPDGSTTLLPSEFRAVERLYAGFAPGRSLVRSLLRMAGANDGRLLVQFYDSRELCVFEPRMQAFTLVASPRSLPGILHVPVLREEDWRLDGPREHVRDGFVYTMRTDQDVFGGPEAEVQLRVLAFYDADKDGTIDRWRGLRLSDWNALGYGKPSAWVR